MSGPPVDEVGAAKSKEEQRAHEEKYLIAAVEAGDQHRARAIAQRVARLQREEDSA